jgi:hypothetical protein
MRNVRPVTLIWSNRDRVVAWLLHPLAVSLHIAGKRGILALTNEATTSPTFGSSEAPSI